MRQRQIDPRHTEARNALRAIGFLVLVIGGIFLAVGVIDFFASFGSFRPPRLFWCAFVGMPLVGIGIAMLKAGFMGAVARYQANEYAPVAKDTFNYIADETQDGVRTVASAIGDGLRGEGRKTDEADLTCPDCGASNQAGSKFCDQCGGALPQDVVCPGCGESNDPDARYCDRCGRPVGGA